MLKYKIYDAECNPRFQMYRKHGKFPSNLLFGFENEITFPYGGVTEKFDNRVCSFLNQHPYLYAKDEYSNNGIEVNSHPMNFNFFLKNDDFINHLAALRKPGMFYINPCCGHHIHLSRKFFTKKHLVKMAKFFYEPKHDKFLFRISKRSRNSFNNWSSTKIPKDEYNGKPYTFKEVAGFAFDSGEMDGKGFILNFAPKNTIELRLFKGTLNPTLFKSYLEFAMAVTLFTRDTNYDEVTIKNFKKYVKNNLKTYKNLDRLISNPNSLKV